MLPPGKYGAAAALAVAFSVAAHISWRRDILITSRTRGGAPPVVIVGGWAAAGTHVFELGSLNKLGTTSSLGSYSEAVLPFPGTCTLAAGSTMCCDGSKPSDAFLGDGTWSGGGMGFTAECAVGCALRTATFTFSSPSSEHRSFVATPTSAAPSHGQAPDGLALHASGSLLVANFGGNPPGEIGGNAGIVPWRRAGFTSGGAVSLVASSAAATPVLHPTSHIHYIATDESCGYDAYAILVDAGTFKHMESPVWAMHIVNPRTASIEDTVHMPQRPRQITLHPALPVAYVIYEFSGEVGVWSWPRCSKWRRPFDAAATPATPGTTALPARPRELQRLPTTATGTGPPLTGGGAHWGGPAAPTRSLLSPSAGLLHVCGRNRPTGEIATFTADPLDGKLSLVGFTQTVGTNPRECALSPDGATLLEVDTDLGTLASYDVSATGALRRIKVVEGVTQANTLLVWAPPPQCYTQHA